MTMLVYTIIKRRIQLANRLLNSHGQGSEAGVSIGCSVSGKETIQHRKRGSASLILFYYETTKMVGNDLPLKEKISNSHLCHGT